MRHEGLAFAAFHEAVSETDLSGPEAFHFRPGKDDARFEKFKKFVILAGLAVVYAGCVGHIRLPRSYKEEPESSVEIH